MAALLFYPQHHCRTEVNSLPTDLSRISMPMCWHQATRKVVNPAAIRDICFVKPSHGIDTSPTAMNTSTIPFDPRHPDDIGLWMKLPSPHCLTTKKKVSHLVVCCSSGRHLRILLRFLISGMSTTESLTEDRIWNTIVFWDPQVSKVSNVHVRIYTHAAVHLRR